MTTVVQEIYGSGNNIGTNNGTNNNGTNNIIIPVPVPIIPVPYYFKLGSLTRRHSVIGCVGYEYANPQKEEEIETKEEEKETKEEEKEEDTCSICLEQQERGQKKNLATTPCGHTFCLTCLLGHLKYNNSCPLCRAPIEENAKKIATPISYDDGVSLLNYELTSLRIEEDIEQFVQNAIEIAGNSQTDGSNVSSVVDDLMVMVANFGFNLLYDAVCHMQNGEENVDPQWQHEMYGEDSESGDDEGSSDSGGDDDDESEGGNLTTISSIDNDDEDDEDEDDEDEDDEDEDDEDDDIQKEEGSGQHSSPWGNMYQLPDID
jgi:hypothetical protein